MERDLTKGFFRAFFCTRCGLEVQLEVRTPSMYTPHALTTQLAVQPPSDGPLLCPRGDCRGQLKLCG